jgi:hypothetical protein
MQNEFTLNWTTGVTYMKPSNIVQMELYILHGSRLDEEWGMLLNVCEKEMNMEETNSKQKLAHTRRALGPSRTKFSHLTTLIRTPPHTPINHIRHWQSSFRALHMYYGGCVQVGLLSLSDDVFSHEVYKSKHMMGKFVCPFTCFVSGGIQWNLVFGVLHSSFTL